MLRLVRHPGYLGGDAGLLGGFPECHFPATFTFTFTCVSAQPGSFGSQVLKSTTEKRIVSVRKRHTVFQTHFSTSELHDAENRSLRVNLCFLLRSPIPASMTSEFSQELPMARKIQEA